MELSKDWSDVVAPPGSGDQSSGARSGQPEAVASSRPIGPKTKTKLQR